MNVGLSNSSLSPFIVQSTVLNLCENILNRLFIISIITFIPGVCGCISSLIVLKLKSQDKQYDGIKHYYSLIFLTDFIVIIIYPINGWISDSFYQLLRINILWNNESIFCLILCKLIKYDLLIYFTITYITY